MNEWSNKETELVWRLLSNQQLGEFAEKAKRLDRISLEEELREYFDDLAFQSRLSGLLFCALNRVNWKEIVLEIFQLFD